VSGCAISLTGIIGLVFFGCTVNTEVHLTIFNAFLNHLADEDIRTSYIQARQG
jgi:hypothetical protein